MRNKSRRIALCGMFAALSLTCMLMGSIFPFSTFLAPTVSGILLLPIVIEYGKRTGLVLFTAISLLSIFMVADKEMALIFIFFLGWYPVVKLMLDKRPSKVVQWCMKFALFNISIIIMYSIVLFLFPIAIVVSEFEQMSFLFIGLLLIAGNVTFVIYDIALNRFLGLYLNVWRTKIMKNY